jgi:hypothetical protein
MSRWINASHLRNHLPERMAYTCIYTVEKIGKCKMMNATIKAFSDRYNKGYCMVTNLARHINLYEAIKIYKNKVHKRGQDRRVSNETSNNILIALYIIKEEHKHYGMSIPNTSDVYEPEIKHQPKRNHSRHKRELKERKQRQEEFIKRWNKVILSKG